MVAGYRDMDVVRWIVGVLFCGFAAYVAIGNWTAVYLNFRHRQTKGYRPRVQLPVIGPLAAYLGVALLPVEKSTLIWLIPLVDPSTWSLIAALPFMVREICKDALAAKK